MDFATSQSEANKLNSSEFMPLGWKTPSLDPLLQSDVKELILAEYATPIEVSKDLALRAKIIDACGLTCTFCHNEGTPVLVDNPSGEIAIRGIAGRSGRISVFSGYNGVDFLPGRMEPEDQMFEGSLKKLKNALGLNELHLTGGEPTLHPRLPGLIRVARNLGYSISMTSNGEMGYRQLQACAEQGLSKVNFSIFGTTAEELAEVQSERFKNTILAQKKLDSLHESITKAADCGIKVAANLVMGDLGHRERVLRLIEDFDPRLELRILPDLSNAQESTAAIYTLLSELGARPMITQVEAGSSNARVVYALPNGRTVIFKQIRPTRLEECDNCQLNNPTDCMEGFYGTRLYVDNAGQYKVGVCIQRMDLVKDIEEFVDSDLCNQVLDLREREYEEMRRMYSGTRGADE